MRPSVRRGAVAAALVLTLAACGLSDSEEDAADALAGALGGDRASEAAQDSADCVAETWVGETGTDPLVEDGLLTEDLALRPRAVAAVLAGRLTVSRATAEGYAVAWVSCADFDAIALDREADHPDASAEDLDEYADCLKEVDDDLWRAALTAQWVGDTRAGALRDLATERAECERELAG